MDGTSPSLRVDKWLWAARFFKTRSLATGACTGGKVDINDEAAKPARLVRAGDLVKVTLPQGRRRIVKVVSLDDRRGSATIARALYEDLTPPEPARTIFTSARFSTRLPKPITGRRRESIAWQPFAVR